MNMLVGQRDLSSQEVCHLLMSTDLYSSTETTVSASLINARKIRTVQPDDSQDAAHVLEFSILDKYASREQHHSSHPELLNVNFSQFVSQYILREKKIQKRRKPAIPKIWPNYSASASSPNYHLYCKYALMRYKPWTLSPASLWSSAEPTAQEYIDTWRLFLQSPTGEQLVPQNELHMARTEALLQDIAVDEYETIDNDSESNAQEAWMTAMDREIDSEIVQTLHTEHDTDVYPNHVVEECRSWLASQKELNHTTDATTGRHIDTSTFTVDQQRAFTAITTSSECQTLMLIVGTAGTGKSYLIEGLKQHYGKHLKVAATTGIASFNIRGQTLHSLLHLPIRNRRRNDLQGEILKQMQHTLEDTTHIIIDEYSMIGCSEFFWVDARLRQASGKKTKLFGGFSVILVGDPAQLPPVGDTPLYISNAKNERALAGHALYRRFTNVVILTEVKRQDSRLPENALFKDLLHRLRNGTLNSDDCQLLRTRAPLLIQQLHGVEAYKKQFHNAIHLFPTVEAVMEHNYERLTNLQSTVYRILAKNTRGAQSLPADEMYGLQNVIHLSKDARVVLTMNLWIAKGLVNGAKGTVQDILYYKNCKPPALPTAVIVKFDDYDGPSVHPHVGSCVPICPITVTDDTGKKDRTQLPLMLCWAATIHKSQGLTLPAAVVDLGKREFTAGLAFVALSRVKSIHSLALQPFPQCRLVHKVSEAMQRRITEEDRLQGLSIRELDVEL